MTTTAIESKIKRPDGTEIPFGTTVYKFVPYTDGAHVCDIPNTEHADRLLSITEGFCLYRGDGVPVGPLAAVAPALAALAKPAAAPAPQPAAEPAPLVDTTLLTNGYPASFEVHGKIYHAQEVARLALLTSGTDAAGWNALSDERRSELLEAELNALEDAGPVDIKPSADLPAPELSNDRDALVAQYAELFGKKPHYNLGVPKLQEMIAAQLAAKHS